MFFLAKKSSLGYICGLRGCGGMVDTRDLKSLAARRAGSSPAGGTISLMIVVYGTGLGN